MKTMMKKKVQKSTDTFFWNLWKITKNDCVQKCVQKLRTKMRTNLRCLRRNAHFEKMTAYKNRAKTYKFCAKMFDQNISEGFGRALVFHSRSYLSGPTFSYVDLEFSVSLSVASQGPCLCLQVFKCRAFALGKGQGYWPRGTRPLSQACYTTCNNSQVACSPAQQHTHNLQATWDIELTWAWYLYGNQHAHQHSTAGLAQEGSCRAWGPGSC